MKRLKFLLALMVISVGVLSAQTPLRLAFVSSDGSVSSIDAKSLSLSVSGENLIASNGSETMELNMQSLVKMYFTGDALGVDKISLKTDLGEVSVFSLDGQFAGKYDSAADAFSSLPSGIYVVKTSDNKSLKIAVQ